MKPDNDRTLTIEGNLDELDIRRTKYGFDPDAVEALMEMMTDNYSDVVLAILRELSTNARDSHVEAGKADVPIKVTLPTQLMPELVIEDEGTGLSPDDAVNTFTLYGYSTKRGSDLYNGMLGIGSKSPLAYADSFTVVARKDGVQTTLIISRDENGVGGVDDLVEETTEPDGVTVTVPVAQSDVSKFHEKANFLYPFWTSPVLIDGEPPSEKLPESFRRVNHEFALKQTGYYAQDSYIVMGDVPYRVSDSGYRSITLDPNWKQFAPFVNARRNRYSREKSYSFVLWVPIGTISFAPSREDVKMKGRTLEVLEEIRPYIKEYGPRMIYEWFSSLPFEEAVQQGEKSASPTHDFHFLWGHQRAPNFNDFLQDYREVRRFWLRNPHPGEPINQYFERTDSPFGTSGVGSHTLHEEAITRICITGFRPRNWSRNHFRRVLECVSEDLNKTASDLETVVIAVNGPSQSEYVDFHHTLNWEDVKARTRVTRKRKSLKERIKGTRIQRKRYDQNRGEYTYWETVGIEQYEPQKPAIWMQASEDMDRWETSFLEAHTPEMQVCIVYAKELKAFQKMYPKTPHYRDWFEKAISEDVKSLDYKDIFFVLDEVVPVLCNVGYRNRNSKFSLKGMRDVRLRRCLERARELEAGRQGVGSQELQDEGTRFHRMTRIYGQYRRNDSVVKILEKRNKKQYDIYLEIKRRIREDYPYLDHARTPDAAIDYVNAMHKHRSN